VQVKQQGLIRFDGIFHEAGGAELGKLPRGPKVKVKSATLRLVVPPDIPNACGRSFSVGAAHTWRHAIQPSRPLPPSLPPMPPPMPPPQPLPLSLAVAATPTFPEV
jgi:hypothetical protein